MYNYNIDRIEKQIADLNNLKMQMQQPPVQTIINTGIKAEMEAKILSNGENVQDIMIQNRTLFVDEKKSRVYIKELDGTISKEYEIIVPKDPKDAKIEELEKKLKEMEMRLDAEYPKHIKSSGKIKQSDSDANVYVESATEGISTSTTESP